MREIAEAPMITTRSIVLTAMLGVTATAGAQTSGKPPAVDPEAIAALQRMGAFLREQQTFAVRSKTETDHVLDSGQRVQVSAIANIRVRRPDHLRVDLISDRKDRQFFYDGTTFTMYAPRVGYYTSVPAPPRILELADQLEDRYGLELPLVDLFRWGTDEADLDEISSAIYVGTSRVGDVLTDQYAFRQPGLDWQIWIERGDHPLPRRIVLTTTDDPAKPQRSIELSWELGVRHEDAVFAFDPPKDAHEIAITELPPPATKPRQPR